MADLRSNFIGIKSPNPFWLASAPPTDKEYNVVRAFQAGWGGVVWKTLGEDPPVVNVSSRYGAFNLGADRMAAQRLKEAVRDATWPRFVALGGYPSTDGLRRTIEFVQKRDDRTSFFRATGGESARAVAGEVLSSTNDPRAAKVASRSGRTTIRPPDRPLPT